LETVNLWVSVNLLGSKSNRCHKWSIEKQEQESCCNSVNARCQCNFDGYGVCMQAVVFFDTFRGSWHAITLRYLLNCLLTAH